MQSVDQDLLETVFSHIETLQNLVHCSAVNKTWPATVQSVHPSSITIPGCTIPCQEPCNLDEHVMAYALIWIRNKNQQRHFQHVQHLGIELDCGSSAPCYNKISAIAVFCLCVVVEASSWPITAYYLDGPFGLTLVLPHLLHTVQHICLHPRPDRLSHNSP